MSDVKIKGLSIKCNLLSSDSTEDIKKFENELTETLERIFGEEAYNITINYEEIED